MGSLPAAHPPQSTHSGCWLFFFFLFEFQAYSLKTFVGWRGGYQQRRGGAQQTGVPAFRIPHPGHYSIAPFGLMIPLGLINRFIRKQYKHVTKEGRRGGAGAEYDMYQLSTYSGVGKMYLTSLHVAEYWRAWLMKKKKTSIQFSYWRSILSSYSPKVLS